MTTSVDEMVICTGCGREVTRAAAIYLDHADTYAGSTWHCAACAARCEEIHG